MNGSGDLITVEMDLLIMEWDRNGGGWWCLPEKVIERLPFTALHSDDDVSIRAISIHKIVENRHTNRWRGNQ